MIRPSRRVGAGVSVCVAFGVALCAVAQPTGTPPDVAGQTSVVAPLAERLAAFERKLDAARVEGHVPGLAVAIVQDDAIVYAKGLGVRDVDSKAPATERTVFGIGSSSKAFTSALLAMLIDDGAIPGGDKGWDAPAHDYVPQFKLKDAEANEKLTLRDLLCHRVGLTRTDLCWYGLASRPQGGGPGAVAGIFRAVERAEPVAGFRKAWNYSNPSFLAAGLAAANAASKARAAQGEPPVDWHTLIQNRIFVPLMMTSTNTSADELRHHPEASKGYEWNEDTRAWDFTPVRDLTAIAPAGAINSTALDMAQWLRLQLGRGTFEGKRLVSKDRLTDTWAKQIDMPGGAVGYGLGWMVHDFNGTPCIEHGGNIDGFAAQVAFLPERNVGVVLLTNVSATPLAGMIGPMAWDALFPPPPDANALPSEELQPLVGSYAFDQLKITCKVLVKDGKLHIDVPGQTVYELRWPDKDGKWAFALTDTIKIEFDRATGGDGKPGKVLAVRLFQAGLTFRLPRDGVPQPPEPPGPFTREQLTAFEGTYRFEPRSEDWECRVENGRLGFDVPGQRFYLLKWPDDGKHWKPDLIPNCTLEFVKDDAGAVSAINFTQNGQTNVCKKTAAAVALPTLDELMAARAKAVPTGALERLGVVTVTGTIDLINQGIAGTFSHAFDARGRLRQSMDLGEYGTITEVYDGATAVQDMMGAREVKRGRRAAELGRGGLGALLSDPREVYAKVEVSGVASVDGVSCAVLACTPKADADDASGGPAAPSPETLYVARDTGLVHRVKSTSDANAGIRIPVTVTFSDFRPYESVTIPRRMTIETEAMGKGVVELTAVVHAPAAADSFRLPEAASR